MLIYFREEDDELLDDLEDDMFDSDSGFGDEFDAHHQEAEEVNPNKQKSQQINTQ